MNKKLGLAVAGALVAFSSVANAGITIPAGDWTIDLSGNVNSYINETRATGSATVTGGLAGGNNGGGKTAATSSTGLLPNFLSFSGKTRQNDLDVTWLISLNPGGYSSTAASGGSGTENRQAFFTFGDASWGTVKIGKDLGIYASDAILSDMTLLGVGNGANQSGHAGNTTTLGRIGTGYQYADWKQQVSYTTPNFNGFQATVGITQGWNTTGSYASTGRAGAGQAYEGKASYSFAADAVTGKVWVSGFAQKVDRGTNATTLDDTQATSVDVGATLNASGASLTAYYYTGSGTGTTFMLAEGYSAAGKQRDSDGYYVQATYVLPTIGTKLGLSYGESNLDLGTGESNATLVKTNSQWTAGVYHPLTKSVNLVAEYSDVEGKFEKTGSSVTGKDKTVSLGAILFF